MLQPVDTGPQGLPLPRKITDKGLGALGRRCVLAVAILLLGHVDAALAADLKVGANIGNVPWWFHDASGNFVGFEIDLINEFDKRLAKSIEVVNIPFQGLFAAIHEALCYWGSAMSSPLETTGPVGRPDGDLLGGSRLTANMAPARSLYSASRVSGRPRASSSTAMSRGASLPQPASSSTVGRHPLRRLLRAPADRASGIG